MDLKELLGALGFGSGLPLIGALLIGAMWNADSLIREEDRVAIGRSTRAFWSVDNRSLRYLVLVFDKVYGVGRLFRPRLRRFLIIGPVTFATWALILTLIYPRETHMFLIFLQGSLANDLFHMLGFAFLANVVFDYLSVWKTRALLSLPASSIVALLVAIGDMAFTLAIYVTVFVFVFLAINPYFSDPSFISKIALNQAIGSVRYSLDSYVVHRDDPVGFLYMTTILANLTAALWSSLYAMSAIVISALSAATQRPLILNHLDFEAKPLQVNGTVSGIILITLGGCFALFHRLASAL